VITGWTLLANISGSIVLGVKKTDFATYPTATSIAGTEKPTLSSSNKSQDLVLSTWDTEVSEGDIIEYSVESVSTITKVSLFLHIIPA
jgi:hypothetical protein